MRWRVSRAGFRCPLPSLLFLPSIIIRPKMKTKPLLLSCLCLQRSEICFQTRWGSKFLRLFTSVVTASSRVLDRQPTTGSLRNAIQIQPQCNQIEMQLVNAPLDWESEIVAQVLNSGKYHLINQGSCSTVISFSFWFIFRQTSVSSTYPCRSGITVVHRRSVRDTLKLLESRSFSL